MDYAELICNHVLKEGMTITLTATGTSMWPLITEGMKAEIVPLASKLPEKGSLLLIKRESGFVVHRCWRVDYEQGNIHVLTKGDTNLGFDQPVPLEMIHGEVTLLKHARRGYYHPNRGAFKIYGKIICSSRCLARMWARICRFVLRTQRNTNEGRVKK